MFNFLKHDRCQEMLLANRSGDKEPCGAPAVASVQGTPYCTVHIVAHVKHEEQINEEPTQQARVREESEGW